MSGASRGLGPELAAYVAARLGEIGRIRGERGRLLKELASHVRGCVALGRPARLIFICTHNSRRSQLAQVWAWTSATYHGVTGVESYSGGTKVTAFNVRVVAALERAGFDIRPQGAGGNPVYAIRFGADGPTIEAFSKLYDQRPNPTGDFCAVMICSQADESCPAVRGASRRVVMPYEDPGVLDGTECEAAAYDERCREISREMLYLFSRV